jgi:predicted SprT family Zn-dependent metalloprotease
MDAKLTQRVKPQWFHPLLEKIPGGPQIDRASLEAFAYDYYVRFMPFFRGQPEGSLLPGVQIEFNGRMKQKLGLAYLFERRIKLNLTYFTKDPRLLPYTLFHELTHIWLYDCLLDPGHTRRFYAKMNEFKATGLPVDQDVHIHRKLAPEAKYIYSCPNCENRWYVREKLRHAIYCGHCFEKTGREYFAQPLERRPPEHSGLFSSGSPVLER